MEPSRLSHSSSTCNMLPQGDLSLGEMGSPSISRSSSTDRLLLQEDLPLDEGGKQRTKLETLSKSLSGKIDALGARLDRRWASIAPPISRIQGSLDIAINTIVGKLSPIDNKAKAFFRNSHRVENRLGRFAIRLLKSPLEGAYNVVKVVLCIFKLIANALIHPVKTVLNVGKALTSLINPKMLTLLGASILGGVAAVAAIFGVAPIFLVIAGAALIVLGLTLGGIDAVLSRSEDESIREALKKMLFKQFKKLPAKFMTGFIMGSIVSGIVSATVPDATTQFHRLQEQYLSTHRGYWDWNPYHYHYNSAHWAWDPNHLHPSWTYVVGRWEWHGPLGFMDAPAHLHVSQFTWDTISNDGFITGGGLLSSGVASVAAGALNTGTEMARKKILLRRRSEGCRFCDPEDKGRG